MPTSVIQVRKLLRWSVLEVVWGLALFLIFVCRDGLILVAIYFNSTIQSMLTPCCVSNELLKLVMKSKFYTNHLSKSAQLNRIFITTVPNTQAQRAAALSSARGGWDIMWITLVMCFTF